MKKFFGTYVIGAILVATLGAAAAQPVGLLTGDKEQKEKVKIVVVDKKQAGGGPSQKPRSEDRQRKP